MKRIKCFIFLIAAWGIGISNVERVGNLVEAHAAQPNAKAAYEKACNVLDRLNQGDEVNATEVQAAIDNLLKALVPNHDGVDSTTSRNQYKLKAGLESAICAYKLYIEHSKKNINTMVRLVLCSDNVRDMQKLRKDLYGDLGEYNNTVRKTFLNHISKHWFLLSEKERLQNHMKSASSEISSRNRNLQQQLKHDITNIVHDTVGRLLDQRGPRNTGQLMQHV